MNDVPIFAKGSNEIPIDILPERGQNRQKIRYLLESAVEVNMNMLRVWGGGKYLQINKTALYCTCTRHVNLTTSDSRSF